MDKRYSISLFAVLLVVVFCFSGCNPVKDIPETAEYRISKDGTSAVLKRVTTKLQEYSVPENVEIDGTVYSVTEIGDTAFCNQGTITALNLPSTLRKIGSSAFLGCTSLQSAEIPEGVTMLGSNLFEGCSSLERVTIPYTVIETEGYLFYGCNSLRYIKVSWPGGHQPTKWDENWLSDISEDVLDITAISIEETFEFGDLVYQYSTEYGGYFIIKTDPASIDAFTEINGIPVIGIGEEALAGVQSIWLYGLQIPENIRIIEDRAFMGSTVDDITLPSTIEILGKDVFKDCEDLERINVSWEGMDTPEGWDKEWNSGYFDVFSGDQIIQKIIDGARVVYDSSLHGYRVCDLKDRTVRSVGLYYYDLEIVRIDDEVFAGCNELEIVKLPETLVSIGSRAFADCTALPGIEIPEAVTEMGSDVFSGCSSLGFIDISGWETGVRPAGWNEDWKGDCIANENIKLIIRFNPMNGEEPFEKEFYRGDLISVESPVRNGYYFDGWYIDEEYKEEYDLSTPIASSMTLYAKWSTAASYDYLVSFDYSPFEGGHVVKRVKEGETVELPPAPEHDIAVFTGWYEVRGEYFDPETPIQRNYNLIAGWDREFPDSDFTYILNNDLSSFTAMLNDEVPEEIIIPQSFRGYPVTGADLSDAEVPINVTIPEGSTPNIVFSDTVVSRLRMPGDFEINNNYIKYWYSVDVRTLEILEGSRTISDSLFYSCDSLEKLILPEGLVTIEKNAFQDCRNLSEVVFPSTLKTIGERAFVKCAFASIVLPSTLETIEQGAFDDCPITTVTASGDASYSVAMSSAETWYVSEGTKEMLDFYPVVVSDNLREIVLPEGLERIGEMALYGTDIEEIIIPDTVREIGKEAFKDSSLLKSIAIPEGVSILGNGILSGCTSLISVELNAAITEIPESSFRGCTSLKDIIIPENITKIGSNAFYQCSSLSSISLPDGLLEIGEFAFTGSGIISLVIPESVETVGVGIVGNCEKLESVSVSWERGNKPSGWHYQWYSSRLPVNIVYGK